MTLQIHDKKSASMEPCFYGAVCNRKDCIYRHDVEVPDAKRTNEACLSFLAGTCKFTATTCKKRHPPKQEAERLKAKYSKIQCRFGDDCKTNNCLYTHPRDAQKSDPVAFLEHSAFPPLSNRSDNSANLHRSAWRAAPLVSPPKPDTAGQSEAAPPVAPSIDAQAVGNPQEESTNVVHPTHVDHQPSPPTNGSGTPVSSLTKGKKLNVNAKMWQPGVGLA